MWKHTFVTRNLTDTDAADLEGVGTIRFVDGKLYKWVKFDNGAGDVAAVANQVCCYVVDSGYFASTVTSDTSVGGIVAGIFTSVIADGEYGWIQIKGAATLAIAIESSNDGSPAAAADDDPLCIGDADGTLRRQNTVIDAAAERVYDCAHAADASEKEVVLDCVW